MKILKRTLKIVGYVFLSVLVIIILLAGFTQTSYFKDRLRTIVISNLSTQVNGSLYLGTIRGNFISGFGVDSLAILRGSQTVFSAASMEVQYDPLFLFKKRLHITYLNIEQPSAHFERTTQGQWNTAQLIKSSDSATGEIFDWMVTIDSLVVKRGNVSLIDSASLLSGNHPKYSNSSFEYHNFVINDINLTSSILIDHNQYSANISQISLYTREPEFDLKQFKGNIDISPGGISAKDVYIQTSRSNIELDASLRLKGLSHGIELSAMKQDSTRLHITATTLSLDELKQFIPQVDFLNGNASLECEAEGEFGNLNIKRLDVRTLQSSLKITGNLRNLHDPENLNLSILIGDSKVNGRDISKVMPTFHLPNFERLGMASVFLEFNGTPLNFKVKTLLNGKFGDLQIDGALNLERDLPQYSCTFTTKDFNIGDVIADEKINTSLSALGTLQGQGLSLDSLTANLFLNIDSSKIQDIILHIGQLNVQALPNRLDVNSSFSALDMDAAISGHADFSNKKQPKFDAEVDLTAFDLSKLLNDPEYESNLTLRSSINGSGVSIDDFSGNINLSLLPSVYQGRNLSPLELNFLLDQHSDDNKKLSMQSSVADIEFNGKFDLDVAVAAIANQSANLLHAIQQHSLPPESTQAAKNLKMTTIAPHTASQRSMDFTYSIKAYDLEPVSSFLGGKSFNARGMLSGAISGTDERLTFSADGVMDEFFIGSVNDGIFLNHSQISLSASNLKQTQTLVSLSATMNISLGSGFFNTHTLHAAAATLDYNQLRGRFTFTGIIDSLYQINFGGQSSIQPHTYVFDLDSLMIAHGDYRWHNEQDVQTRLDYDGFRVMRAFMKRQEESLTFSGAMKHSGEIDFHGELRQFDLEGLGVLLNNPEMTISDRGFTGKVNADLNLSGTTSAPIITFAANTDNIFYKQTQIGRINANISYAARAASLDIEVHEISHDSTPSLVVGGTLPIDLAFTHVEHRFPDTPQKLFIISDAFNISLLDPLIADLQNLNGKVRCNVTIEGTPRNPQYKGTISLNDVSCIFRPNNILYTINGDLEPSEDKLLLKKLIVTNAPSERLKSDARFTGSVSIKDFQIDSFDITAYGRLLLMTKATRKVIPTFYGSLLTEIDNTGLNLRGTPLHPYLSGTLSILDSEFEYPSTTSGYQTPGQTLNYVIVDDTSKATTVNGIFISKFYRVSDTTAISLKLSKFISEPSFVDRLHYNLNIETKGTTTIKMIFTPTTNEALYAEIEGKVNAINDRGIATIYGDINIQPGSYYNFFKRFEATGKLKFVGPWDNPELDIDATYESYSQKPISTLSPQSGSEETQKSNEQKVIVELKITGTRYIPKLVMDMKIQTEPGKAPKDYATVVKGGDVQADAISFIITGKFRDQLSSSERENIATNFGSTGVSGLTSTLLSGIFTDFLRKEFPFIRSAEFSYGGGSIQQSANLRLSGEAFNGYFRFGGRILNDIGNANVSYQLSIGRILNVQSIRNLFIELERKVEGSDFVEDRKLTNNARLFYRISF